MITISIAMILMCILSKNMKLSRIMVTALCVATKRGEE